MSSFVAWTNQEEERKENNKDREIIYRNMCTIYTHILSSTMWHQPDSKRADEKLRKKKSSQEKSKWRSEILIEMIADAESHLSR